MKEIILSLRRTPYQTTSAFLVLFFTLFLSLILFITFSFLQGILVYIETRPQVTVYFQTKTPESEIFRIRDTLSSSGKVLSLKYISQKDAFQIYQQLNKDNPLLLEMVSADILPPSLEIYAKKAAFLPEIAEFLKKQPGVDEVQFQKDIVDRLLTLINILRKGGSIFYVFLLLMSTIVLTTTTLFKIALKKDEIEILKLLGATNSYIRKPFILEAVFLGLAASTLAFILFLVIFFYLKPFLTSYLLGLPKLFLNLEVYQLQVWPFNFLFLTVSYLFISFFGVLIAILATFLATSKYLKV